MARTKNSPVHCTTRNQWGHDSHTQTRTDWAIRGYARRKVEQEAWRVQLQIASEVIQDRLNGEKLDPKVYDAAMSVCAVEEEMMKSEGEKQGLCSRREVQKEMAALFGDGRSNCDPDTQSKMRKMLKAFARDGILNADWDVNDELELDASDTPTSTSTQFTLSSLAEKEAYDRATAEEVKASIDADDVSSLSDSPSDISDLDPSQEAPSSSSCHVDTQDRHRFDPTLSADGTYPGTSGLWLPKDYDPNKEFPDPHRAYMHHALTTLKYDTRPTIIKANEQKPGFIIKGLKRPLTDPDLTWAENHEIQTILFTDEIDRLATQRAALTVPEGLGGEWQYEHFGCTRAVRKRVRHGGGILYKKVYARGSWGLVVQGVVVKRVLDEWPMNIWDEPLGWMVKLDPEEDSWEIDPEEESEWEGEDDGVGMWLESSVRNNGGQGDGDDDYEDDGEEDSADDYVPRRKSKR